MKELFLTKEDIFKHISQTGNWEEGYQLFQEHELKALKENLKIDYPSNSPFYRSREGIEKRIERIEAIFAIYKALVGMDVSISFVGLTHTMQQYAEAVIMPMKKLVEEGKLEEALQLYKQPRRYHR